MAKTAFSIQFRFSSPFLLRMGTPPVASGSSNCTCAVLEYGSTWSMDGEDGVSAGRAHMETQMSPIQSRTQFAITKHISFISAHSWNLVTCILSPKPISPMILSEHAWCPDTQASISPVPSPSCFADRSSLSFPLS